MVNIYDDVATLQEQVAALQTTATSHNARFVKTNQQQSIGLHLIQVSW